MSRTIDRADADEALAVVRGRLGETPSGPLFVAIHDPTVPHRFVLTGLGIALAIGRPEAEALIAAARTGLGLCETAA